MNENLNRELIEKEKRISDMELELNQLNQKFKALDNSDSVAIVCFSGEWDKLFAAFTIANGALALGKEVHMFFTFWGASAIRKKREAKAIPKSIPQKLLGWMLPKNISETPLSKMNMGGLGKRMLGKQMKAKGIDDLQTLMDSARELGAHFHCCDTSLQLMGWDCDDLLDGKKANWCGVSAFLSFAFNSRVTLFI